MSSDEDLQRLKGWFSDGTLASPGGRPDLVDFSRALASLCGAPDLKLSAEAGKLRETIGPAEHHVLVLIDGLGVDQLERFPREGFLHSRSRVEMRSVFLSSTAPALTSLYTGLYPGRHGVLSWWLRLAEHQLDAVILPFTERFEEKPLVELGVDPAKILTAPSLIGRMTHRPLALLPQGLVGSVYSTYSSGGTQQAGYEEIPEAFELAAAHVLEAEESTFTYLYLPQADSAAHSDGCDDVKVLELFALYDRLLRALARRLSGKARITVTGDHGQVDVPDERAFFLDEGDPLAGMLACPISGEPVVPFFHVAEGRAEEFAQAFRERWGAHFALISREQVLELGLLGPGAPTPEAAARTGEFLAIPPRPATLRWRPREGEVRLHRGEHGGLSYAESTVPLFAL